MKQPLKKLIRGARDFASMVAGGKPKELLLAQEKREYEHSLRAQGYSRKAAAAMTWERYANRG